VTVTLGIRAVLSLDAVKVRPWVSSGPAVIPVACHVGHDEDIRNLVARGGDVDILVRGKNKEVTLLLGDGKGGFRRASAGRRIANAVSPIEFKHNPVHVKAQARARAQAHSRH